MRILLPLSFALLLAACQSAPIPAPKACPRIAFVPDAETVFHYLPGRSGEDEALVSRAALANYGGQCSQTEDGKIDVEMFLAIAAQPGPALAGKEEGYDYFVAVLAPDGTPLAKKVFHRSILFEKNAKDNTTWVEENLHQRIPLASCGDGGACQIVIGFQLTPDELTFNRTRK
ncbi:MAG TPA: hypothetical protein DCW68_00295 [Rhodospirillaceae bacterium]|nr:MAG: hypothetical protein A2018_01610 [Alphaproteobacteria bacterium GWF2_58_20]HAU28540.1 hypothetical protein [Rhodospirillaceae bacterium]